MSSLEKYIIILINQNKKPNNDKIDKLYIIKQEHEECENVCDNREKIYNLATSIMLLI